MQNSNLKSQNEKAKLKITSLALSDNPSSTVIEKAVEWLKDGRPIVYPTDTVYGLGADATNEKAVEGVFKIKGRGAGRGVAAIFQSIEQIKGYCQVTTRQEAILSRYLPGPYTFLLKPKKGSAIVSQLIDSQRNTLGVRIPDYPLTKALATAIGKPYTTTSANRSGWPAPQTVEEVKKYLLNIPDRQGIADPGSSELILLIDGGKLHGRPSTVVDLTKTPPVVVRTGAGSWRQ